MLNLSIFCIGPKQAKRCIETATLCNMILNVIDLFRMSFMLCETRFSRETDNSYPVGPQFKTNKIAAALTACLVNYCKLRLKL